MFSNLYKSSFHLSPYSWYQNFIRTFHLLFPFLKYTSCMSFIRKKTPGIFNEAEQSDRLNLNCICFDAFATNVSQKSGKDYHGTMLPNIISEAVWIIGIGKGSFPLSSSLHSRHSLVSDYLSPPTNALSSPLTTTIQDQQEPVSSLNFPKQHISSTRRSELGQRTNSLYATEHQPNTFDSKKVSTHNPPRNTLTELDVSLSTRPSSFQDDNENTTLKTNGQIALNSSESLQATCIPLSHHPNVQPIIPAPKPKLHPLQCQTCKYKFARRSNLNKHIRSIHHNERKFGCVRCGFLFKRRDHLDKHVKSVHLKERNFSCDICGVSFAEKYNRDSHKKTIHEKKRHLQCGCGAYYRNCEMMAKCLRCRKLGIKHQRNILYL